MMNESEGNNGAHASPARPSSQLGSLATRRATSKQRRVWSRRVSSWDRHGSANLGGVTSAVLSIAQVAPGANVLDLGCGTGQISIPLAMRSANVLGVDVSSAMVSSLRAQAHRRDLQSQQRVTFTS